MSLRVIADERILDASALERPGVELSTMPGEAIAPRVLRGVDALFIRTQTRVDAALIEGSSLRFIASATIGFDHVDLDLLRAASIPFVSAAGSSAASVGQYSLAVIERLSAASDKRIAGRTLGVVGVGAIGRRVADGAEKLGMKVLRIDPPRAEREGDTDFAAPSALAEADWISLHVPLSDEGPHATRDLVDARFLEGLKPGVSILNCSRGAVIDEAALRARRASGKLGRLALDVFQGEPCPDPATLAICDLVTPHVGGRSLEGLAANTASVLRAFEAHFDLPPGPLPPHPTPPPLSVQPDMTPAGFIENAWALDDLDADLRRAATSADPARSFSALRNRPPRRDLDRFPIVGECGEELRSFLDALPRD